MSRFFQVFLSFSWFLPGLLLAAAPAEEIVQLPSLTVSERSVSDNRPSVIVLQAATPHAEMFSDLARQTPGLSVNDAGARGFGQTTTLRGLGNTPFFSDASAPVYLDDIPLATAVTFPSELYDFDRVSIHRGPQAAAQFGRAADAGVIRFTSTPPQEKNSGRVVGSSGNYDQSGFAVSTSVQPNENFSGSFNVGANQRDGYIYNTELQQTVDDREAIFGRMKLRYQPAADLELSLHLLGHRFRDGAQALVPLDGPYDEVSRGQEGESDTDFYALALGVTKQFTHTSLTATSSFTDWELSPYSNRLVVYGGSNFDSVLTQSQRTFNEEVRLVSERWSAGAFFSHGRTRGGASRSFDGFTVEDSSFALDSEAAALFGQANFTGTSDWRFTPGLRLDYATKDFTRVERVPSSTRVERDDDWSAFSPSLAVTRQFNRATDLTFTLARGFKAGGYSAYTGRADLAGYRPQHTWSLEGAFTTASDDDRWTFTTRAYASRVSGYQIERSFAVPATSTDEYLVVNADRARVLGLELESLWHPLADWTVSAAAGITHVTLEDFTDPFTGLSYSGNRAPYAPAGSLALGLDYRPARGFFAGAGASWTGETFFDEQETAGLAQKSYTLLNAHAGYSFGRGDVRLFGRNLGDKHYYSSITPGVAHGTPGAPLTWGGEFNYRW